MSEEKVNVVPPVVNSIEEEGADSKNPRNITRNGFEPTDEDQRQEPVNISSKRRKLKRKNDSISPPPECVSDACFPSREEVSVGKVRIRSFASIASSNACVINIQPRPLQHLTDDYSAYLPGHGTGIVAHEETPKQPCVASSKQANSTIVLDYFSAAVLEGQQSMSAFDETADVNPLVDEVDSKVTLPHLGITGIDEGVNEVGSPTFSLLATGLESQQCTYNLDEKPAVDDANSKVLLPDLSKSVVATAGVLIDEVFSPASSLLPTHSDEKPAVDDVDSKVTLPDPGTGPNGVLVKTELDLPPDVKLEPDDIEEENTKCDNSNGPVEDSHYKSPELPALCKFCFYTAPKNVVVATYFHNELHNAFHNAAYEFQCFICAKLSGSMVKHSSLSDLQLHFAREHQGQCPKCGECFPTEQILEVHVQSCKSPMFGTEFTASASHPVVPKLPVDPMKGVEPHIPPHYSEGKIRCNYCFYQTTTSAFLNAHRTHFHSKKFEFQCFFCEEKRSEIVKHFTLSDLGHHFAQAHLGETRFRCSRCGQYFLSKNRMKIHVRDSCPLRDPYLCPNQKCPFTCQTWEELEDHTAQRHSPRPMICPVCFKSYKSPFSFNNHLETHSGVIHKCVVCKFESPFSKGLELHYKKTCHNKPKAPKCDKCSYAISSTGHPKKLCAKRAKLLERKWVCDRPGCDQKFRHEIMLKRHLNYHDIPDDKWFCCVWESCPFQATNENSLKKHYTRTRHNTPFKCVSCDLPFSSEKTQEDHNLLYHFGPNPRPPPKKRKKISSSLYAVVAAGSGYLRPNPKTPQPSGNNGTSSSPPEVQDSM